MTPPVPPSLALSPLFASGALRPGAFLADKYRVERILGQGGMGVVIAATHLSLQQQVAIKLLLPELTRDEDVVARFLQEARAQVRIQGDHVVRVLDVGTLPDLGPFMVMEMLAGEDLSKVLERRGALPMEDAIDYVLQAAEALAQAHSLGIVHRDLKPQNMFLTTSPDGSPLVKVLDFGISKSVLGHHDATRRAGVTTGGGLLGSPAYMSPEQVRNPKDVTARSDIWSLGIVLYELLSDRLPFPGSNLGALLTAILADAPVDLRTHRPDLPESIVSVVMRCLSKDASERPMDVAELALALAVDAPTRVQASRVDQIVRRFSKRPPALEDGIADTMFEATAMAPNALPVAAAGAVAREDVPRSALAPRSAPPSSPPQLRSSPPSRSLPEAGLEWANTIGQWRPTSLRWVGYAAGAVAVVVLVGIAMFGVGRAGRASAGEARAGESRAGDRGAPVAAAEPRRIPAVEDAPVRDLPNAPSAPSVAASSTPPSTPAPSASVASAASPRSKAPSHGGRAKTPAVDSAARAPTAPTAPVASPPPSPSPGDLFDTRK